MAEGHSTPSGRCTWCGAAVEAGDGYRASEQPGARVAVFCRLEHVVPWVIKGAHWEAGEGAGGPVPGDSVSGDSGAGEPAPGGADATCAHCDQPIGDVDVTLVRHRGEHRIADHFC